MRRKRWWFYDRFYIFVWFSFLDWSSRRNTGCDKLASKLRCGKRRRGEEWQEIQHPRVLVRHLLLRPPILQVSESLHPPLPSIERKRKQKKKAKKQLNTSCLTARFTRTITRIHLSLLILSVHFATGLLFFILITYPSRFTFNSVAKGKIRINV